jgi:hypothetical protein
MPKNPPDELNKTLLDAMEKMRLLIQGLREDSRQRDQELIELRREVRELRQNLTFVHDMAVRHSSMLGIL